MYYGIEIRGEISAAHFADVAHQHTNDKIGIHIEVNTEGLEFLKTDYQQYLRGRIPESDEWESTSYVMYYLSMNAVKIRLLGFQPEGAACPVLKASDLRLSPPGLAPCESRN